jgi:heterodisulfide reductase subunit A
MKKSTSQPGRKALIIGGGIAGAAAALRLSRFGFGVDLVEKKPAIGGRAAEMGCKAAEICLRCNVCVAADTLAAVLRAPGVRVRTRCQLKELGPGTAGGRYRAVLSQQPNYIQRERCTGCGACVAVCPAKCIAVVHPVISGGTPVLDISACRRSHGKTCVLCARACPTGAIDLKEAPSQPELEVDAVVAAPGFEPFDPSGTAAYGYGQMPNVITGLEAERRLAQTSRLTRPLDGKVPARVAFIQCVGSRSEEVQRRPEDTDYCSAVCCAYAFRMARALRHGFKDTALTVFYMDVQNFGKDFNRFFRETSAQATLVRSRPYEIKAGPEGTVRVRYAVEGGGAAGVAEAEFDLVVLAIGMRPPADAGDLAEKLGVALDPQGFFGLKGAAALPDLQRKGIFAIGAGEAPKDIAGCLAQAEAVSALILSGT